MKIGILTFHRSINDGAVMQCYSLSKYLMKMFPDDVVEVIDYHMPKVQRKYEVSIKSYLLDSGLQTMIKRAFILLLKPGMIKQMKARNAAFEACLDKLPLSKKRIFDDGVDELFRFIDSNYDVVIAGSDAIWNYNLRGFPNPYFLSDSICIPKFSYAASCYGMLYENIPAEQKKTIRQILNSYNMLGVRDDETAKFAEHMGCSISTVHTCDPTVFLDVNSLPIDINLLKQKMQKRGFNFTKPAIGIMSGNKMCRMVRKMFGNQYQLVALQAPSIYADVNLHDLNPYEWAYVFRFFKLTFTTFFHGTLVSLRNGIPVIAIALESDYAKTHTTKVQDFLVRVNMEDCYFHTDFVNEGIEKIREKAELLLCANPTDSILTQMDGEAQSGKQFIQQLMQQMKNEEKKND